MSVSLAGPQDVGSKEAEQNDYRFMRGRRTINPMVMRTGTTSDDIEIAEQRRCSLHLW